MQESTFTHTRALKCCIMIFLLKEDSEIIYGGE